LVPVGGLGRRVRRLPRVIHVEAATFEDDTHRLYHPSNGRSTLLAHSHWVVVYALANFKSVAFGQTLVFVKRHSLTSMLWNEQRHAPPD
jgi:hypothetical protein